MSSTARLGAFILGALVLLGIGVFLIGDRQYLFSRTYHLEAPFDTVVGLDEGAVVRAGGVRIGMVDRIRLPRQSGDKVMVVMRLDRVTRAVIKRDSVASIETEGLLGNKFVSLSFGSKEAESVGDGDAIQSVAPFDYVELAKKASQVMDDTRGTMAEARDGVASFRENMEALKSNLFLRGFFKKRGYDDVEDLAKHEIEVLPKRPSLKQFVFAAKELFARWDTAKLKDEKSLDEVGKFLENTPFGLVAVTAYAGLEGEKDENLTLTKARAMVVRQYLANFRIDDTRIRTKGMGEDEGAGPGEGGRVEIIVYPREGAKSP